MSHGHARSHSNRSTLKERQRIVKPAASSAEVSDEEMWDDVFRHTLYNPHQHIIQILDRNGDQSPLLEVRVLQSHDATPGTSKLTTIQDDDGRALRLAISQTEYVKILFAYPLDEINRMLGDNITVRLFVSLITVIIALIGGLVIDHQLSRPVNELAFAAERVTAENLNVQLPVSKVHDEVGRMTETFNKMIQRLHASFEEIHQFSAEASHELRTPLTFMRGEIEVALRNRRLTRPVRELLVSIHDELVRLSGIVENLMMLVKSKSGRLIITFGDVRLESILHDVAEEARVPAGNKKIKIVLDARQGVIVRGDAMRLRQLFLNLVENAVKFTRPLGTIYLGLERHNGNAVVSVRDTGIGIPRKHRARIFERLYRIAPDGQHADAGVGLGLSIATWIVEAHDGRIDVKSRELQGSTFAVRLPLSPSHQRRASP